MHTILERGRQDKRLEVVVDQTGTPTYAADLAQAVMTVLTAPAWMPGIYNSPAFYFIADVGHVVR